MEKTHAPNAPLPDATELSSYHIVRIIARGSSSFVYLAENKYKQLVAIKEYMPQKMFLRERAKLDIIIPPQHIREFRQYLKTFLSECRTLLLVTHPRIVRRIDFFRAHNTFYLVTNYEPGSSLKDFIRHRLYMKMRYKKDSLLDAYLCYRRHKKNIIGPRQVIGERLIKKICADVIGAVSAIHDREFLYLDLKPANIYLHSDGTSFLLDFGAARRVLEKNRKRLNWVYTRGFAAPELLRRQHAWMGPWTDAYSIGATIFACMCGYPPQSADQRGMKDSMPQAIKALRKLYSSDLLDLLEWCLHLDRKQRPQTMAVLQERLLACQLDHEPPPKRKFVKRFSIWFRRKIKIGSSAIKYN
jgi:serine/threonine protein kinase